MNRLLTIIIMLLTLFLNSCNEKEFREELKFVNSILENPKNIQQIIETSQFYDSTYFNLHGRAYIENIQYLTSEDKSKVKVDGFGKPSIPYYKKYTNEYEMIKDAKVIYVKKEGMPYILYFMFREYNEKSVLVGINIGYI